VPSLAGRRIPWRVLIPVAVAVAFGLLQLVPMRITHPPVTQEPPWDSPTTRRLAVSACYDCHSNQTRSFWYEHVEPVSWWIHGHVTEGRAALNFSEFDAANHRAGAKIAREVTSGSMPPSSYTWLWRHPAAKLTPAERRQLAAGLVATFGDAAGRHPG
jgi:hypothetical protein